jgi:hypothetical protein
MKKLLVLVMMLAFGVFSSAHAQPYKDRYHPIHVKEYTKKNGTVVHEHYRAKPRAAGIR